MKEWSDPFTERAEVDWRMPRLPNIGIPRFSLHTPDSPGRMEVESYIRTRFASVHGADINHFLPNLIS